MENRVNYKAVGLFIVILAAAGFTIIVWLTTGISSKRYKIYLTVVHESVSGLSLKAPVKYNGVTVGYVDQIKLDPNKPRNVILVMKIEKDVAIHQDATATIDSAGLTGIAYVGVRGGSPNSPLLRREEGQLYPMIKSQPSLLVQMDKTVKKLSEDLNEISHSLHGFLSMKNQRAFSQMLQSMAQTTTMLNDNIQHIDSIIKNTDTLIDRVSQASIQLPRLVDSTNSAMRSIGDMSHEMTAAGREVKQTMRKSRIALGSVTDQILPVTTGAMENVASLAEEMQKLSRELNRNPSLILRGRKPEPLAPGEQ